MAPARSTSRRNTPISPAKPASARPITRATRATRALRSQSQDERDASPKSPTRRSSSAESVGNVVRKTRRNGKNKEVGGKCFGDELAPVSSSDSERRLLFTPNNTVMILTASEACDMQLLISALNRSSSRRRKRTRDRISHNRPR